MSWPRFILLFLAIVLRAVLPVQAHPGVGIVQDSAGNIYYTDLKQVWKLAPDGKKSVAVPNVHTHELCLDGEDNLFGEHLWYEGDATKKMLSMLRIDHPSLDWVKLAEGQGVPATRATTAEEFHKQFEAAMSSKGLRLIEAQIVQTLKPMIDAVHNSRG